MKKCNISIHPGKNFISKLTVTSTTSNVKCVFVHFPAFSKVGWYDGLVDSYMSAVPSVTVANTTCHLPRGDAFRLFRDPVSGDLPWPGLVFGLTVLATWVWCTDQVTLPALTMRQLSFKCVRNSFIVSFKAVNWM